MIHKNKTTSIDNNGTLISHTQSVIIDGIEDTITLSNLCGKFVLIRQLIDQLNQANISEITLKINGNELIFDDTLTLSFSDKERAFLKELSK